MALLQIASSHHNCNLKCGVSTGQTRSPRHTCHVQPAEDGRALGLYTCRTTTTAITSQKDQEATELVQHQQSRQDKAEVAGSSPQHGTEYYVGLLTSDIRVDNSASGPDMLNRSLQFAGAAASILAVLTYLFLASNHLA